MKYRHSRDELIDHWNEHLDFIRNSAEQFDNGKTSEAKRLATSLRVLFHETSQSHSLLHQTGNQNSILVLSSVHPYVSANLSSYWGLLKISGDQYVPVISESTSTKFLSFDDWWNEIILDDKESVFTRKDVVWYVANQDGGAHVDPGLDVKYAKLAKHNSLGWIFDTGTEQIPIKNNPALASVRQISHEVLVADMIQKSVSKYTRMKKDDVRLIMNYVDSNSRYLRTKMEIDPSGLDPNKLFISPHTVREEDRFLYLDNGYFPNGEKFTRAVVVKK